MRLKKNLHFYLSLFATLASLHFTAPSFAAVDFSCEKNLSHLLKSDYIQNTWGVEIELYTGKELSRKDLSYKLHEFFVQKGYDAQRIDTPVPNSPYRDYAIVYQDEGRSYNWGLPFEFDFHDFSKGRFYPGVEITTPILRTNSDQKVFNEVVDFLNTLGVEPAREVGGTHVHWGAKDLTIEQATRIYNGYFQVYKKLKKFFRPDEGRGHIEEQTLNDDLYRLTKREDPQSRILDIEELDQLFRKGPIRYNIANGTLETRFFNSTNDPQEILFYIEFSRRFIFKILEDTEFYYALPKMETSEIFKELALTPPKSLLKEAK